MIDIYSIYDRYISIYISIDIFALFSRLARGCVDRVEYVQGEQLMILGQLRRPDVLDLVRGLDADYMKRALVKLVLL